MTAMLIAFDGATYTLTTEVSGSSYGVPVLVGPDGTQYAAREVVLSAAVAETGDWFADMFAGSPALTALDIVSRGEHAPIAGEAFRDDGELTAYGHETARMFKRFAQ